MFTVEIEHNVWFFVFERRRAIFLRSELKIDKNGRNGSTRRLCGESQPRFIFVRCIFIGASIMHPSDCRAVTIGARNQVYLSVDLWSAQWNRIKFNPWRSMRMEIARNQSVFRDFTLVDRGMCFNRVEITRCYSVVYYLFIDLVTSQWDIKQI